MKTPTPSIIRGFAAVLATTILCGVPALQAAATPTLPPSLRPALYRALVIDGTSIGRIGADGCAALAGSGLKGCFAPGGERFARPGGEAVALRLAAFGRSGKLAPVAAVRPVIVGNRVTYWHPGFDEWWRALPAGFEQGFTIDRKPRGDGPVTLALVAGRSAAATGADLAWGKIRYGGLVVTDAHGRTLPATLKSRGRRVLIAVDDDDAAYPLTVDPLVWIQQKMTAADGAANDEFGWSVAVSGDNALIGAPSTTVNGIQDVGTVYAFTRDNGTWTETQEFHAMDAANGDDFGWSLALDGTTALIGAATKTINGYIDEGAAYVFTLSNGTWTQRARLTRNTDLAHSEFGYAVALSNGTAVIGGFQAQHAAYVFTGSGSAWVQTAILTPSDGTSTDDFGTAVALDGTTALIGAGGATVNGNAAQGAAYVYTNSGGIWSQAAKLTASDGSAGDAFGSAVAISGNTAFAGAPYAVVNGFADNGAVYVFSDSGGTWSETQKFDPINDSPGGLFGAPMAISGDNLLVGAPYLNGAAGSAYVFTLASGTWTQTQALVASDAAGFDVFGAAVALDGTTALAGAFGAQIDGNTQQGAAYFYGGSDLDLALDVPSSVNSGDQYTSQSIVTNSSSDDSAALSLLIPVPTHTSYVAANATQGSCQLASGTVTCMLGSIDGNGGSATANVTLKATGSSGDTADNSVGVSDAEPSLSASAPTSITGSGGGGGGGGGSGGGGGATSPMGLALLGLIALFAFARRRR